MAPTPLPVNMVKAATKAELRELRATNNWGKAARMIVERDDCIASMKRDGHWESD